MDANATTEEIGKTYYGRPSLLGGLVKNRNRHRSHLDIRVIVMDKDGQTAKIFEEAYSETSSGSEERANRYAFKKICQNIHERLKNIADE